MSLLGPDDFDLSKKERKKKLAKDLSPEVYKQIERWLDRDDAEAFDHLTDLVGPEEARRLMSKKKRKGEPKDSLLDEF
ncbi:MAG: hypothetical protein ACFFED_00145 [Candidatus Thorarchaeota archaeon]